MNTKQNEYIKKLVCTWEQAVELRTLGIIDNPVVFYHGRNGLFYDRHYVEGYSDKVTAQAESVPAWTKAELDVMIGPNLPKPDLWTDKEFLNSGKNIEDEETEKNFKQKRAQERESYPVFYPEKLLVYKNGAEASAEVLLFLLKNDHIKLQDANARHKKIFGL